MVMGLLSQRKALDVRPPLVLAFDPEGKEEEKKRKERK
jgi:hypothetical protein